MGPSLVLSALTLNMADWDRDDASLDTSNDEDDDESNPRSARASARWSRATTTGARATAAATTSTTGAFGSPPPVVPSPIASAAPATSNVPYAAGYSRSGYDAEASFNPRYTSAPPALQHAPFRSPYEFSPPAFDCGVTANSRLGKAADEEEDERKPAARPPSEVAEAVAAAHRALIRGAFDDSPEEESPPLETLPAGPDQYLNPTLSFGDDEEVLRNEGNYVIDGLGIVSDPNASMEGYAARVPTYAPPFALVFKIGSSSKGDLTHGLHPAGEAPAGARATPRRNLDEFRRVASAQELALSSTDRAKTATATWYDRFNELIDYAEVHGDCNVPQKYAANPQLGIVSVHLHQVYISCSECSSQFSLCTSGLTSSAWRRSSWTKASARA
jgi:Helicase associated domain